MPGVVKPGQIHGRLVQRSRRNGIDGSGHGEVTGAEDGVNRGSATGGADLAHRAIIRIDVVEIEDVDGTGSVVTLVRLRDNVEREVDVRQPGQGASEHTRVADYQRSGVVVNGSNTYL